jgi:hypothetical protein
MFKQYREIEHGEFFVIGCDTASGGYDYSAAQFLSKTKLDVPLVYHSQNTTSYMTDALVPVLERIHDVTGHSPVIAYETNNGGSFELERLAHLNRLGKYRLFMQRGGIGTTDNPQPKKYGFTTSSATRPVMLQDLKEAIDNRLFRIYHEPTVSELFAFIVNQTSTSWRAQAEKGAHDDLVMSLAIAWQLQGSTETPVADFQTLINQMPDENLFKKGGFY